MLPPYEAQPVQNGVVRITFDPPITKAALGIPFSFLVMQRKETQLTATRFGRIQEITCEANHWVAYLKTLGVPIEQVNDFKEIVGYQEPEPSPEPAVAAVEKE
jgi:hypothetical protein